MCSTHNNKVLYLIKDYLQFVYFKNKLFLYKALLVMMFRRKTTFQTIIKVIKTEYFNNQT